MKPSAIYRKAAVLVDDSRDEYSCVAIARCAHKWNADTRNYIPRRTIPDEVRRYSSLLDKDGSGYLSGACFTAGRTQTEAREHRVLALLLMSEIAKDDETKLSGTKS